MKIQTLDQKMISLIATGQIVDSPVNVLKELLENALDAEPKNIEIVILDAGKSLIQISDDGHGMSLENLKLSIHNHSTSKISNIEDIYNIRTFGFRGEALHAIDSISQLTITSATQNDNGYKLESEKSDISISAIPVARKGTSVTVRNLFYNTPKKISFLASNRTENNKISDMINGIVLSNPKIRFSIKFENKKIIIYHSGSLLDRICQIKIFGTDFLPKFYPY